MKRNKAISVFLLTLVLITMLTGYARAGSSNTLMFGSRGEEVRALQSRLKHIGYYYREVDGFYNKAVEDAVIRFQKHYGLRIDGIADPGTQNKLYSLEKVNYWVQPGDSWYKLSQRFDVPIWEMKNANNYYQDWLSIGQRLEIPVGAANPSLTLASQNDNLTQEEFELLVRAVYSEARGEPYKGQVAVAAVVLNRVEDSRFPDTIEEVVFEPWAFTAVHDGQFWLGPNETAERAAQDALNGWDPSGGALFYYNPQTATSYWVFSRQTINRIGKHVFAV